MSRKNRKQSEEFKIKEETGNFFKTQARALLVKPAKFQMSKAEPDELNEERLKVKLSFVLLKGSYATILIKRLFENK